MSSELYELLAEEEPKPARPPLPTRALVLLFSTLVWFLLAVPHVTNAGTGMMWLCLLVPVSFIVIAAWSCSIAYLLEYDSQPDPRVWRVWGWSMAVIAVIVALIFVPYGLTARVWLSSGPLLELAQSLPASEDPTPVNRCVGHFYVQKCETSNDGAVAIVTCDSGMMDCAGVLYLPPGSTAPSSVRVEEHLYGPWYRFWWKW